jgi:chromosomal replication initiation ATPase DnaA
MKKIPDIDKIPGLKDVLSECRKKVEELVGHKVTIHFNLKFHHLPSAELARIICQVCEVSWEQVISENRKAPIVIARHLYAFFALKVQKKALWQVQEALGRADHSTICHARDKVQRMIDSQDDLYMPFITECEKRIGEFIDNMVENESETN